MRSQPNTCTPLVSLSLYTVSLQACFARNTHGNTSAHLLLKQLTQGGRDPELRMHTKTGTIQYWDSQTCANLHVSWSFLSPGTAVLRGQAGTTLAYSRAREYVVHSFCGACSMRMQKCAHQQIRDLQRTSAQLWD